MKNVTLLSEEEINNMHCQSFGKSITSSVSRLREAFGKENSICNEDGYPEEKVHHEWDLLFDDGKRKIPFSIYDYKEKDKKSDNEPIFFHIGTSDFVDNAFITFFIKYQLGEEK